LAAFWRNSFSTVTPSGLYPERPDPSGRNEWVFVTPRESKGWILDAICREIGSRQPGSWQVVYNPNRLPDAEKYFFSHYWNYLYHLKKNPHIRKRNTLVWYTHPRDIPFTIEEQVEGYNQATCVVFSCSEYRELWIARGVQEDRTAVVLGGADPALFRGHKRGRGHVGLSSSFYERKSPDTVLDLVRAMPERRFTLVGRQWDQYQRFSELKAQRNFRYVEASYRDYPRHYARFDVFLSLAMLEGGPISLLEAMMENAVPVASRTGFSPDIITDGDNGYLFPVGSEAGVIVPLIEAAFANTQDIRASVSTFTWDDYAREMHRLGSGEAPNSTVVRTPLAEAPGSGIASDELPGTAAEDQTPEARTIDVRLEERFATLGARLAVPPSVDNPLKVIIVEVGAERDVLEDFRVDSVLAGDAEPFLILTVRDASLTERLAQAIRRSGQDGLIGLVQEPVEILLTGLPGQTDVAVIRPRSKGVGRTGPEDVADADGVETLVTERDLASEEDRRPPGVEQDGAFLTVRRPAGRAVAVLSGEKAPSRTIIRLAPARDEGTAVLPLPSILIVEGPSGLRAVCVPPSSDPPGIAKVQLAPADFAPRMLNVFRNRAGGGNAVVEAFAASVAAPVSYAEDETGPRPGIPVVWGVLRGSDRVIEIARGAGQHFFYIDHAYFGRGHGLNYRISRNAYEAGAVRDCPPDRISALGVRPQPWRTSGSSILVCPPTQHFMDAHGCPNWLNDTLDRVRRATDRPVEIRRKPRTGEPVEPLENALGRTWAVVTHSSNIAVEAVTAGVPAFVAPTSAALHVSETDLDRIETPRRPDREAWLAHLGYSQFSFAEIRDGTAWRILVENEGRPLIGPDPSWSAPP